MISQIFPLVTTIKNHPNLKVIILMCTYNGQRYLAEQLDSIANQTHHNWELWISDDGSNDQTINIIESYQSRYAGKIYLFKGPKQGFAKNFLSLVFRADKSSDYYAYADQDDIWDLSKLERALNQLERKPRSIPALYCSRTRLINEQGQEIGFSPLFNKPSGFRNALVQNIGGGNTMVFNDAAAILIKQTKKNSFLIAHDWWTYLLVTGAGGEIIYDVYPTVNYRQHQANLIGGNKGLRARLSRIKRMFQGHLKQWIDQNIQALLPIEAILTEENRLILHQFIAARNAAFMVNVFKVNRLGIYRQTMLGNLGLLVGSLFKKV
ncbi:glycosyltransferase family 2 protein [Legionella gresilensis]|uniref:glycosyltransferase family 2 protein n=1 Tax=Legionella gresilensis TaxID=91823 RepID=UPI001040FAEB|nr:glycosyltransferase family 2 protein [Legionella gresilensis]